MQPLTFAEAAAALAAGTTTSRHLVEACLANINDLEGQGARAFVRVYGDQARASADAIDTLRQASRAPGPFAGIPISLKDLFDIAGEPTPAGSVILADAPPATATAPAIQRLLAAGLIPVGRTNMTEFAFSGVGLNPHYGTPLSPWDRAAGHIPGGSSSGAAVSVADAMALGAIGTDTGGSCRIPAALCGIAGFKPTARRVPLAGVLPLAPSLDSVGPLARTAACCATLDAIVAGEPDRILPPITIPGLRLLLPTNLAFANLDAPTEAALDRAVARLDDAGVLIDRAPLAAFDAINEAHAKGGFAAAEAYAWHRDLLASEFARYDPRVASRILAGADMSAADYFLLAQARRRIIRRFEAALAPYDALMLPTVPIAPPPIAAFAHDEDYRRLNFLLLRNPSAINFLDGCAISLPCHAPGAPPAGLMLAAPAMEDARLLAIAIAVEAALLHERH
jgi:aspartyl-tRNA(Asn)/glutamyl-tRNA(Gln) amidotransferase subunit A